jgi:MFS family permease
LDLFGNGQSIYSFLLHVLLLQLLKRPNLETEPKEPVLTPSGIDDRQYTGAGVSPLKFRPLRNNLELLTWEGIFAVVFITLTGGPFLAGLALFLGANDFEIGLLAAIPFLAQITQLPAAYRIDLTGRCKKFTLWSLIMAREIWWILLPLSLFSGDWRLNFLICVFIISSIGATMGAAGWFSWVADLVPARVRGRYFGFRSAATAFAIILATIFGGTALDHFKSIGHEGSGYSLIIGVSAIFGVLAAFKMNRLPERKIAPHSIGTKRVYFLEPLREVRFRKLIGIFLVWNLGTGVAAAFFAVHMLTFLEMSFTQVSFYAVAALIAAIILNKPWGLAIDRYGSRPVIIICAFGLSIVPLAWLIPQPGSLWILGIEAIYAGALWTGFNLAAFNLPISLSPAKNRTIFLATFAVISGIGFFISSLIGGALAEYWGNFRLLVGPYVLINYHLLFVISSAIRLAAALLMLNIEEPSSKLTPGMFQFFSERYFRRSKQRG